MHLHERNTLGAFEIHRLLDEIERQPFKQNVTVSHAFALADLQPAELEFLVKRMAKLKVGVTTTVAMGAGRGFWA